MDKKILENAEKTNGSIDYSLEIIDLMGKVRNKDLLKRVYKLLVYLYLHKDDEEQKLIEIQNKTFELQRLIHIEKTSIHDFIGQE